MTWQGSMKVPSRGSLWGPPWLPQRFWDCDSYKHVTLAESTGVPCFPPAHPAARGLRVCACGGEPVGAALHEPTGRPHQTLAPAPAVAVLPLAPAGCLHHHVPLLLPGTVPTAPAWLPVSSFCCFSISQVSPWRHLASGRSTSDPKARALSWEETRPSLGPPSSPFCSECCLEWAYP